MVFSAFSSSPPPCFLLAIAMDMHREGANGWIDGFEIF
jgi:hypothetical protein